MIKYIITLDSEQINYIQSPEFFCQESLFRPSICTRFITGNWDLEKNQQLNYSAKYEPDTRNTIGMIPLRNYTLYTSMYQRYRMNVRWEDTDFFRFISERHILRYSKCQARERFDYLDDLYRSLRNDGLRPNKQDMPCINIGRFGRYAIEDGRHRLCMARILSIKKIDCYVSRIHLDESLGFVFDSRDRCMRINNHCKPDLSDD